MKTYTISNFHAFTKDDIINICRDQQIEIKELRNIIKNIRTMCNLYPIKTDIIKELEKVKN